MDSIKQNYTWKKCYEDWGTVNKCTTPYAYSLVDNVVASSDPERPTERQRRKLVSGEGEVTSASEGIRPI